MAVRRYDHPNAIVRREFGGRGAVTSAATNVIMPVYQKIKLVAAHCKVAVAGTSTAANNSLYTLQIGTDSVGAFAVGTQAAGVSSSITLGSTVASLSNVNVVKQGGADGQVDIVYEYEVLPDAVLS